MTTLDKIIAAASERVVKSCATDVTVFEALGGFVILILATISYILSDVSDVAVVVLYNAAFLKFIGVYVRNTQTCDTTASALLRVAASVLCLVALLLLIRIATAIESIALLAFVQISVLLELLITTSRIYQTVIILSGSSLNRYKRRRKTDARNV